MFIRAVAPQDWCHVCGRREHPCCDVWFPEDARHQHEPSDMRLLIRVCAECGERIALVGRLKLTTQAPAPGLSARSVLDVVAEARKRGSDG